MLLTISTTHEPATDLGFLLHKNPERVHAAELSFGTARVVYPEATAERCTAAVVVEVDPVGLVRGRKGPKGNELSLAQYVNDRPYVASSFLSAALNKLFSAAMSGRSKERPELADTAIPIEARLPVVPCRGGEAILRRIFEPLGYHVDAAAIPLDPTFPAWGDSRYFDVTLRGTPGCGTCSSTSSSCCPCSTTTSTTGWVRTRSTSSSAGEGSGLRCTPTGS